MKPKYSGIYKITNKLNGKIYVGESVNIYLRWNEHRCRLRNNYNDSEHLQNAWNKYGEENFEFEVIEKCKIEELKKREHYWVNLLKSNDRKKGYNIKLTNDEDKYLISDETRLKISIANKGRIHSLERNKKISLSKINIKRDSLTKNKISKTLKEKYKNNNIINPMNGKNQSKETKQKISEKAKNRIRKSRNNLIVLDINNQEIEKLSLKDGINKYGTIIYYLIKNNKSKNGYFFKIEKI